jgi:hypothetical protein
VEDEFVRKVYVPEQTQEIPVLPKQAHQLPPAAPRNSPLPPAPQNTVPGAGVGERAVLFGVTAAIAAFVAAATAGRNSASDHRKGPAKVVRTAPLIVTERRAVGARGHRAGAEQVGGGGAVSGPKMGAE